MKMLHSGWFDTLERISQDSYTHECSNKNLVLLASLLGVILIFAIVISADPVPANTYPTDVLQQAIFPCDPAGVILLGQQGEIVKH